MYGADDDEFADFVRTQRRLIKEEPWPGEDVFGRATVTIDCQNPHCKAERSGPHNKIHYWKDWVDCRSKEGLYRVEIKGEWICRIVAATKDPPEDLVRLGEAMKVLSVEAMPERECAKEVAREEQEEAEELERYDQELAIAREYHDRLIMRMVFYLHPEHEDKYLNQIKHMEKVCGEIEQEDFEFKFEFLEDLVKRTKYCQSISLIKAKELKEKREAEEAAETAEMERHETIAIKKWIKGAKKAAGQGTTMRRQRIIEDAVKNMVGEVMKNLPKSAGIEARETVRNLIEQSSTIKQPASGDKDNWGSRCSGKMKCRLLEIAREMTGKKDLTWGLNFSVQMAVAAIEFVNDTRGGRGVIMVNWEPGEIVVAIDSLTPSGRREARDQAVSLRDTIFEFYNYSESEDEEKSVFNKVSTLGHGRPQIPLKYYEVGAESYKELLDALTKAGAGSLEFLLTRIGYIIGYLDEEIQKDYTEERRKE